MDSEAAASSPSTSDTSSSNARHSESTNNTSSSSSSSEPSSNKANTLSCAECRRSKLKCDRVFPCQACIRRGCKHLCPNGTLASVKGTKHLQAQTKHLSEQVRALKARVAELEEALEVANQRARAGTHVSSHGNTNTNEYGPNSHGYTVGPGLHAESAGARSHTGDDARFGGGDARGTEGAGTETGGVDELIDGLGVLSIRPKGLTYHGESASSEYIRLAMPEATGGPDCDDPSTTTNAGRTVAASRLPLQIEGLGSTFPLGNCRQIPFGVTLETLLAYVPPYRSEAERLVGVYYEEVGWLYETTSQEDLTRNIVDPIYTSSLSSHPSAPHRLALFFALLACGSAYDTRLPFETSSAPTSLAERYLALARAAFALEAMAKGATVYTVQALFVMSMYLHATDRRGRGDNEVRWILGGVCTRLAQSIGLHRDNRTWKLPADELDRRRRVFFELASFDQWTAIVNGRPPSIDMRQSDCPLPRDECPGRDGPGFQIWKYTYTAACLAPSTAFIFASRPPPYSTLIELDRTIRQYAVPAHLTPPSGSGSGEWAVGARDAMQQYATLCLKECNLMYLHRPYFYSALRTDASADFMKHKFALSVLATYRSAKRLLSGMQSLYEAHPASAGRCWFFWTAYFSACVVMSVMIVKRPRSAFAAEALVELERAVPFYDKGSALCRPPYTLASLLKLQSYASQLFHTSILPDALCPYADVIDILGGRGVVVQPLSNGGPPSFDFVDFVMSREIPDIPHMTNMSGQNGGGMGAQAGTGTGLGSMGGIPTPPMGQPVPTYVQQQQQQRNTAYDDDGMGMGYGVLDSVFNPPLHTDVYQGMTRGYDFGHEEHGHHAFAPQDQREHGRGFSHAHEVAMSMDAQEMAEAGGGGAQEEFMSPPVRQADHQLWDILAQTYGLSTEGHGHAV